MKMQVRIIDKDNIVVDVKIGQKRRGWIRITINSLEINSHGCPSCVFYQPCCKTPDPICSKIISEVTAQGFYIITPPNFNLAINRKLIEKVRK